MGFRQSIGIVAISQVVTFVLGFANVIIVSRLLAPGEVGIFSVAVSVLGFAHVLREFGVGYYLVQAETVSRQQFRAAFTVAIIASWCIAGVLFAVRGMVATFYGHPGIAEVLLLLAVNFLVLPLGTPVLAMLKRDRQFGRLAWVAIFGSVVQTVVTVGAALAGESYLSMAWGSLVMTLSKMVLLHFMRPGETFVLPAVSGLREVFRFGTATSFSALVGECGRAAPDLIFGRTLGFVDVALFSRGMGVHRMIVDRINTLVRTVHFPTFAADLRSGGRPAEMYVKVTDYLVVVTAPVLVILAVLSEPLILFMFGSQWERSVPIAAILCSASVLTAPYSLYGLSLIAAGRVSIHLFAETLTQGSRILVLLTSIWFPLETVVPLLILAYVIEAAVAQLALRRAFGLGWVSLMTKLWRALAVIPFASAGPIAVVWSSKHFNFAGEHRFAILLAASLLAGLGWLMGVTVLKHPMRSEILRVWRGFLTAARARCGNGLRP